MCNKTELKKRERELAIRVRTIREDQNLKQEYVANEMGIPSSTYSKLENGHLDFKARHLWPLAQALKTTIARLMDF